MSDTTTYRHLDQTRGATRRRRENDCHVRAGSRPGEGLAIGYIETGNGFCAYLYVRRGEVYVMRTSQGCCVGSILQFGAHHCFVTTNNEQDRPFWPPSMSGRRQS